jgi:cation:H+ antiporter
MAIFLMYIIGKSKAIIQKEKPDSDTEEEIFEYIKDQKVLSAFKYKVRTKDLPKSVFLVFVGLVALIFGANLAVDNAVFIADARGWSPEFIGLTVIAFGTCLPELVTCLMAVYKKEDDIAVGNIIGSNIINILLVLGVSSMISPIVIDSGIFFDLFVMTLITLVFMVPTIIKEKISRKWGFMLFGLYVLYLAYKISLMG